MKLWDWVLYLVVIGIGIGIVVAALNNVLGNASFSLLQGLLGVLVIAGGGYKIYSEYKKAR